MHALEDKNCMRTHLPVAATAEDEAGRGVRVRGFGVSMLFSLEGSFHGGCRTSGGSGQDSGGGAARGALGEGGWTVPVRRVTTGEEEEAKISVAAVEGDRGGGGAGGGGHRWSKGGGRGRDARAESEVEGSG